MNHEATVSRNSWLSLVAETAGVAGTAIARVKLQASALLGPARVVVQLVDSDQEVVGATYWYGEGSDLETGVSVDIGCDFFTAHDIEVRAWVDDGLTSSSARRALAPHLVACAPYDENVAMKLSLRGPATPQAALDVVFEAA